MDVALAMIMEPITPKKVKTIMNHRRPQKSAACEMGGPSTTVRIVIDVESQIPLVDPPRACPIAGVSLTASVRRLPLIYELIFTYRASSNNIQNLSKIY